MDRKTSTTERISASMHMYITYKANSVIINANIRYVLFTNPYTTSLNKNQSGTFFDKLCVNLEIIFIVEIRKDY